MLRDSCTHKEPHLSDSRKRMPLRNGGLPFDAPNQGLENNLRVVLRPHAVYVILAFPCGPLLLGAALTGLGMWINFRDLKPSAK
jgi:hypothetical protein